jgi:hypothetical protein
MFSGAYALAIKGKKDNYVWLVRGKDRTLFYMNIFVGEEQLGTIINTSTLSLILIGEALLELGLDYDIKELKENTAYKYNVGNYTIEEAGQILQDSIYESIKVVNSHFISNNAESKTSFEEILDLMYNMDLLSSDLMILSELIFNKPLFILEIEDFVNFKIILEKLKPEAHSSRIELWNDILKVKNSSIYKLYTDKGIQYPFFMNTKEELRSLLLSVKKEGIKDELSPIQ